MREDPENSLIEVLVYARETGGKKRNHGLEPDLVSFFEGLIGPVGLYGAVIHHHGDGNGVYAWAAEQVFLWFYAGDEEGDDRKDDVGRLQDDVPCSCWVRL